MSGIIGTFIFNVCMGFAFIWVAFALAGAIYYGNRRDIIGAAVLLFIFAVPLAHNLWLIIQKYILPLSFSQIIFRTVAILFVLGLLACALNVFFWLISPHTSIFDLICPPGRKRR